MLRKKNVQAECTPHLALLMRISSSETIALFRVDTPLLIQELGERSGNTVLVRFWERADGTQD